MFEIDFSFILVEVDDRHVIAYLLKGNYLMQEPELAISAFRKAYNLQKDILVFQGLVRSYLSLSKLKEAFTFAKEAQNKMPHNPQAITLVALTLSQAPDSESKKKAKQYFEEALNLDNSCLEAVIGLSQLFILEGKAQDAIKL